MPGRRWAVARLPGVSRSSTARRWPQPQTAARTTRPIQRTAPRRPLIQEQQSRRVLLLVVPSAGVSCVRARDARNRERRSQQVPSPRIGRCSDSSISAASGRSNRCAKTAPLPRSRSLTLRACSSSLAGASRTGTWALASGRKRVRERKTGCSPVPVDAGMASALLLAKCRVLSAPDDGPGFGCVAGVSMRERPGPGQCRRVSPTCSFRSHLATSTAGFDLVRRCRFVRPQRLLGCGSRREAWRGFRRRGWRRCSGSARGLARSRCCSCR